MILSPAVNSDDTRTCGYGAGQPDHVLHGDADCVPNTANDITIRWPAATTIRDLPVDTHGKYGGQRRATDAEEFLAH